MRRTVLVFVFALILAACGGGTSTPSADEVCEEAPQQVLDYLATGFVNDAITFDSGQAVKSGDYPDVWIVAGVLGGADDLIGDADAIGIWAIQAGTWPTDYVGSVAVDNVAKATSTWGEEGNYVVNRATDGVVQAEACALASLGG
ncbi:MAG: hypothetical protein ABFS21_08790 [Actinomycetota bacterium]